MAARVGVAASGVMVAAGIAAVSVGAASGPARPGNHPCGPSAGEELAANRASRRRLLAVPPLANSVHRPAVSARQHPSAARPRPTARERRGPVNHAPITRDAERLVGEEPSAATRARYSVVVDGVY
jgi:hypothetical protein